MEAFIKNEVLKKLVSLSIFVPDLMKSRKSEKNMIEQEL